MTSLTPVLFFPWPVGAGHTGRCLVVAALLRDAGYECCFARDPTGGMVSRAGFRVLPGDAAPRRVRLPARGYLVVESLDAAYAASGYYHPGRIRAQVAADRKQIGALGAKLVVTHMQPTAAIAGRLEGVPVVSVADADFLIPGGSPWMPWTGHASQPAPFPPSLPAFTRVLRELGLDGISDVTDLLWTDLVLIASTPDLDPLPAAHIGSDRRAHHVGPLIWDPGDDAIRRALDAAEMAARPRIYLTLGSGEMTQDALTNAAVEAAETAGWSLLAATGYAGTPGTAAPHSPRVRVHGFGGINAAMRWADVVVCHGGHSTVLAALLAGKPVLAVPGMSENEANARAMVAGTGAGLMLHHTEVDVDGTLRIRCRYPDLPAAPVVTAAKLTRAVGELLRAPGYTDRARDQSVRLREWARRGPGLVLRLVGGLAVPAGRSASIAGSVVP